MKDVIFDDFQNSVSDSLLRHKSVLDIITKLQESEARINRAVIKAVTRCGCIRIDGKKQKLPNIDDDIEVMNNCLETHILGGLCENCKEIVECEIGNNLFYLTSLCELLDINLYDVLIKEYDKINTLGKYTFR